MAQEIVTVADALRWVNRLKQVDSEGVQVLMVQHLIAAEREACAKIAQDAADDQGVDGDGWPDCEAIAEAIRARGTK